jgi:hypothetical protein
MANMRLATASRNSLAQQFQALLDAGPAGGTIKIYTGPQPTGADEATGDVILLGTLTFEKPSAPAASGGVLTFHGIAQAEAVATGEAAWARMADAAGNTVFDCDVTGPGGGGTMTLNTPAMVAGGPIVITAFTITVPAG